MPVFLARAKGIEIDLGSETNRARLREDLKEHQGAMYRIERVKPMRSGKQNNFYWAYLGKIELETGNLSKDLHEWFKRAFLQPRFITIKDKNGADKEFKIPASTTKLSKSEFSDYMDKISAWSEVSIPSQEEIEAMGYISNNKPYH